MIERIALIDLDGTITDYDRALREELDKIRAPGEPVDDRATRPHGYVHYEPAPHLKARRWLITSRPSFYRRLPVHPRGMQVLVEMRRIGFKLHVLTKGPTRQPHAWGEKLEWCQEHLPGVDVTVTQNKSLTYGRVLFDDWPAYFLPWLERRPRGLVVCNAQPWNEGFTAGGADAHPRVLRYDDAGQWKLRAMLERAYNREDGHEW